MKNNFCILLSLLIMPAVYCQPDSSRTLNVYYNTFLFEEYTTSNRQSSDEYPVHYYNRDYSFTSSHALSVGIQWQNHKNHIFELELMPFRYAHNTTQDYEIKGDSNNYQLSQQGGSDFQICNNYVRFSYLPVYTINRFRLIPELSVKPYFYYKRINPLSSREFFSSKWDAGIMLEFIPGLQYAINKRFGIQFSIPLTLGNLGYERARSDNPALPLKQRISDSIFFRFFDLVWQCQLGLSCKI